jgi:cytochrome bd-type quinol oxidase subunit 1
MSYNTTTIHFHSLWEMLIMVYTIIEGFSSWALEKGDDHRHFHISFVIGIICYGIFTR